MDHLQKFNAKVTVALAVRNGILCLPEYATVIDDLNLEGVDSLQTIPEGLTVTGNLHLRGTSLRAIPANTTVHGSVDIEGCSSLTYIGENVVIDGDLDIEGCSKIKAIPASLVVKGSLFAEGTNIERLVRPENFGKYYY